MTSLKQLTRLLIIIRKINSGTRYSKKELLRAVNEELNDIRDYPPVSEKTLERDIKDLNDTPFRMNIILRKGIGYIIEDDGYNRLDIEQILEPFDILTAVNADTGLQHIIFTEKYTNKGIDHLYKLIKSIKNSHRIAFDYIKHLEDDVSERILEPYAIKLLKGQWYVVGKLHNEKDLKTFGLDRIQNLRDLSQKFKKDSTIDMKAKFEHSFGIYSSEEYPVEDVVLSFDKADGSYLKTVPLHHSQEIIEETENHITLKLCLRITVDFVMALLSRSGSLKVIEPFALKERVCEIYKEAFERNK